MAHPRIIFAALALGLAVLGCSRRDADLDRSGTTHTTGAQSDNTAMNDRDKSGATQTPIDQGESKTDVETTARVRRMIMEDSTLGFDAKNVKIITDHGVVTLRGPVKDEHERQAIALKAGQLPGVVRVDNQLEIK